MASPVEQGTTSTVRLRAGRSWLLSGSTPDAKHRSAAPASPAADPDAVGMPSGPRFRSRSHKTWWGRLIWFLIFTLVPFWTTGGDRIVDDRDYTNRWESTPINGTDGVCAVTTLAGNLDGEAKHLIGWRSTNLFPSTANAKIVNCSTGQPVIVDDLRLDQAWTDPTCSTAPDIDPYSRHYSPIRGSYADAGNAAGGPDGWWRIPNATCNSRNGEITGAVGVATATEASRVTAKPPRYRLVWAHRHFWQLGPVRSDQFCLRVTVTLTIRRHGGDGSANLPAKSVCVTSY